MGSSTERVYVVIVNWNGWRDTIECLESVFRHNYPDYQVIVCDNDSGDGSLENIAAWAAGSVHVSVAASHPLRRLSFPPVPKPISCVVYDRATAEAGGNEGDLARLILIKTGGNLGFAGGNNVALRYACARGDFGYVWLLNNDTVVAPDALSSLVSRMRQRPEAGQCGSTLLYYDEPGRVQARGGATYNRWTASAKHLGEDTDATQNVDVQTIEKRMSYIVGASILVRRSFLLDVGLLSEDYFLYFEELDWATRGRRRYAMAYSRESLVYHKHGQSIEAAKGGTGSSAGLATADYYYHRNRLLYTRRYFPLALPAVCLRTVLAVINQSRKGERRRALGILRVLVSPRSYVGSAA